MPQFLFVLFVAAVILFIKDHFLIFSEIVFFIIGFFALAFLGGSLAIRINKREAEKADMENKNRLRLEPLKDGETVVDRIEKRFRDTCQGDLDRIANMRVRGIESWRSELDNMLSQRLLPVLSEDQKACFFELQEKSDSNIFEKHIRDLSALKERQAKELAKKLAAEVKNRYDPFGMTPGEFENWCRDMLRQQGWVASVLGGSGDQGADVLATRGQRRLVVQCKYYSFPVGNAAVQEVYAAKSFYSASHAAVVTNSTYTNGGIELANKTGVILLSANDLMNLDQFIYLSERRIARR